MGIAFRRTSMLLSAFVLFSRPSTNPCRYNSVGLSIAKARGSPFVPYFMAVLSCNDNTRTLGVHAVTIRRFIPYPPSMRRLRTMGPSLSELEDCTVFLNLSMSAPWLISTVSYKYAIPIAYHRLQTRSNCFGLRSRLWGTCGWSCALVNTSTGYIRRAWLRISLMSSSGKETMLMKVFSRFEHRVRRSARIYFNLDARDTRPGAFSASASHHFCLHDSPRRHSTYSTRYYF